MKTAHFAAGLAFVVLVATSVAAQDRQQFNEHDRQVAQDWYTQHQKNAPAGLRSSDRLPPEQESHLKSGEPYSRDLQQRAHSVPRDLSRRLPSPPKHHKYVAVGGHVALVDTVNNIVRDVIRVDTHSH
jgi:Ni/Co efflux regulator RcnB